jgi:hypothetical protein
MVKRLTLPILASALILATAAFSSAHAARFLRGGHIGHSAGHGPRFGQRHYFGQRRAIVRHPVHWRHGSHGVHWRYGSHAVHWRHGSHGVHWRHGSGGGTVYLDGGSEAYPVTGAAATCPGNCLGKEYLQDGSVRFYDRCTQESAVAVPGPAPRG